jgi:hypothetical protein
LAEGLPIPARPKRPLAAQPMAFQTNLEIPRKNAPTYTVLFVHFKWLAMIYQYQSTGLYQQSD